MQKFSLLQAFSTLRSCRFTRRRQTLQHTLIPQSSMRRQTMQQCCDHSYCRLMQNCSCTLSPSDLQRCFCSLREPRYSSVVVAAGPPRGGLLKLGEGGAAARKRRLGPRRVGAAGLSRLAALLPPRRPPPRGAGVKRLHRELHVVPEDWRRAEGVWALAGGNGEFARLVLGL